MTFASFFLICLLPLNCPVSNNTPYVYNSIMLAIIPLILLLGGMELLLSKAWSSFETDRGFFTTNVESLSHTVFATNWLF